MFGKIRATAAEFFFAPASAAPLATLRILLSATLLVQAYLLSHQLLELYSAHGILQPSALDYLTAAAAYPNVGWLQRLLEPLGIGSETTVRVLYAFYLGALVALLLGWRARLAAFFSWAAHFLLLKASFLSAYGVDQFANVFLFYLIWMPSGDAFTVDNFTRGKPSAAARFSLRVLQIELCIVYFTAGWFKAVTAPWWNGEAIYRSVTAPLFAQFDMTWLAHLPWLAKMICWSTLIFELGYPIFMWPRRTRTLWLAATVGLHLGISLFLGLHSFAAVMIVLTVSAFGVNAWTPVAPRPAI